MSFKSKETSKPDTDFPKHIPEDKPDDSLDDEKHDQTLASERSRPDYPWASDKPTKHHLIMLQKQMEVFSIKNHQGTLSFKVNKVAIADPSNFNNYYKHGKQNQEDLEKHTVTSAKPSQLTKTAELPEPKDLEFTECSLSGNNGKSIPSFKSSRLVEPDDAMPEQSEKNSANNRSKENTRRTKESMVKSKQQSSKESEHKAYLRALEKIAKDNEKREMYKSKLSGASSPRDDSQGNSQADTPFNNSRFNQLKGTLGGEGDISGNPDDESAQKGLLKKTPSMQDLQGDIEPMPFDSLVNKPSKGLGLHISSEFAIPSKQGPNFERVGSLGGSSSPKSHRESMHMDSEIGSPTSLVNKKNHDLSTELRECRILRHTYRGLPKPVFVDKAYPFGMFTI